MHKLFPLVSLLLLTLTIACTETVYHTQDETNRDSSSHTKLGESCTPGVFEEFCQGDVGYMCDYDSRKVTALDCNAFNGLTCRSRKSDHYTTCTNACTTAGAVQKTCTDDGKQLLISKCDYDTDNHLMWFDDSYENCGADEFCSNGNCRPSSSELIEPCTEDNPICKISCLDGKIPVIYNGESGDIPTLDNKVICATPIRTAKEFLALRDNEGKRDEAYYLVNDIDLGDALTPEEANHCEGIQNFSGYFLSDGKTISFTRNGQIQTLTCDTAGFSEDETAYYVCGLFNDFIDDAVLINFNIKLNINSLIKEDDLSNNYTLNSVGILSSGVYSNNLIIHNVHIQGNVEGYSVVGGFIGHASNTVTIKNSTFRGNVHAKNYHAGGYIGSCWGCHVNFYNCDNYGDIDTPFDAGGFIGRLAGGSDCACHITSSNNYGNISSNENYDDFVGENMYQDCELVIEQ